jgi:hypothetical protein
MLFPIVQGHRQAGCPGSTQEGPAPGAKRICAQRSGGGGRCLWTPLVNPYGGRAGGELCRLFAASAAIDRQAGCRRLGCICHEFGVTVRRVVQGVHRRAPPPERSAFARSEVEGAGGACGPPWSTCTEGEPGEHFAVCSLHQPSSTARPAVVASDALTARSPAPVRARMDLPLRSMR